MYKLCATLLSLTLSRFPTSHRCNKPCTNIIAVNPLKFLLTFQRCKILIVIVFSPSKACFRTFHSSEMRVCVHTFYIELFLTSWKCFHTHCMELHFEIGQFLYKNDCHWMNSF